MIGSVNKREFLAGSAIGAAWAFGGRLLGRGADGTSFDRRIAAALVDARTPLGEELASAARRAGVRTMRFDGADARIWRDARAGFGLRPGEAMIGLTGWSDWTLLRPALAEHRKLARTELRIDRSDMAPGELVPLLAGNINGRSPVRLRSGITRSGHTQFGWLVA
ncbi:hypothetical protein [Parasphingopyxis marina]|uniref:Uncharacterized protein n=1 Tax=Parasphingopyxis marina TaxID=2761622 RepID=A0A842HXB5_9SPHN|nr:hypothetical protein [Parasphingopyxis marina]MBC2777103.1 hypothetical protein [Parasphingopyxis marina]